jgi:predicted regulator of Ras-like GTPase activity (Roadblock/LC7/MglB family)
MLRMIQIVLVGLMIAASCATAIAQAMRMRGTIEKIDGDVLTVKSSDGSDVKLTVNDKTVIVGVVKASMADIKAGTFLGSAAMPQPDGTQKALEVHIFPEQMRGTNEGHRPYEPVPNSTMTNGAVDGSMVSGVDGSTIMVKYKDGAKKIFVPPNTPIVRYEIGGKADLRPGARLSSITAAKKPDGTFEATRINVDRDTAAAR